MENHEILSRVITHGKFEDPYKVERMLDGIINGQVGPLGDERASNIDALANVLADGSLTSAGHIKGNIEAFVNGSAGSADVESAKQKIIESMGGFSPDQEAKIEILLDNLKKDLPRPLVPEELLQEDEVSIEHLVNPLAQPENVPEPSSPADVPDLDPSVGAGIDDEGGNLVLDLLGVLVLPLLLVGLIFWPEVTKRVLKRIFRKFIFLIGIVCLGVFQLLLLIIEGDDQSHESLYLFVAWISILINISVLSMERGERPNQQREFFLTGLVSLIYILFGILGLLQDSMSFTNGLILLSSLCISLAVLWLGNRWSFMRQSIFCGFVILPIALLSSSIGLSALIFGFFVSLFAYIGVSSRPIIKIISLRGA